MLINWSLLREPYNWIICTLMVLFAVVVLAYLAPYLSPSGD